MNRNEAAALNYASKNWKIFPLLPQTKRPLTRHGFKEATDDPGRITLWWTEQPGAGIGLATGETSNLLVIDIDPRNNGTASFAALLNALGPLPDTLESVTGGGGRHLFFHCPNGMNSMKGWAPGVDIKAKGGYVCVPFTKHPNGTVYHWVKGRTPANIEPAKLPAQWLTALTTTKAQPASKTEVTGSTGTIPDGQRHDKLLSLAGAMRRQGSSADEITAALLLANDHRCKPPMSEEDVRYLAKSLDRYQQGGKVRQFRMSRTVTERAATEPKEIDWLLEDFVAMGDVALLAGPPEAGKSWLFLDLAICAALGIPAFGHFPTARSRVLVIDEENTQDEVDRRLYNIVKAHGANPADLENHLFLPDSNQGFSFRDQASTRALHDLCATCRPDLILMDSLVAVSTIRDEASATDVRFFFHDKIFPLRSAFNATIVLAHHTNKGVYAVDRPAHGAGLIRGSIDFVAAVDSAMMLDKSHTGDLTLNSVKVRRGPKPKPLAVSIINGQLGGVRPLIINPPSSKITDSKKAKARKVLFELLSTMSITLGGRELLKMAREKLPTCDKATFRSALNELRKDGQVQSERKDGSVTYWLAS